MLSFQYKIDKPINDEEEEEDEDDEDGFRAGRGKREEEEDDPVASEYTVYSTPTFLFLDEDNIAIIGRF